jgi:hypothetical protein
MTPMSTTATIATPAAFAGTTAGRAGTGPATRAAAPRKGFWQRFFEAYMRGRMRQAEREIQRLRHLIPQDELDIAGYRVGLKDSDQLPFGR